MEVPRIYREQPTRVSFVGFIKQAETGQAFFKYPGGEVPFLNVDDFRERLMAKGFGGWQIEEILGLFGSSVATETAISFAEVVQSQH